MSPLRFRKRGSRASHVIDYQLVGDQFSTPEMRAVFDEHTLLAGPFVDGAVRDARRLNS